MPKTQLTVTEHSRDITGMRYIYPVISRRAGGVSIGINLNVNNACNWRCLYCQVPELKLGTAPPVDLALLERELTQFLHEIEYGDFMQMRVPEASRRINDIALSGNGESTSAAEFPQVIQILAKFKEKLPWLGAVKLVLITNGSLLARETVQIGLRQMATLNGEIWFKLDRASAAGLARVNDTQLTLAKVHENLSAALACCANTWLQTCWFAFDGQPPSQQDEADYLDFLRGRLQQERIPQGVLLYGLARASMQPEAPRLQALSFAQLEAFAARIRQLGLVVKVSP